MWHQNTALNNLHYTVQLPLRIMSEVVKQTADVTPGPEQSWFQPKHAESPVRRVIAVAMWRCIYDKNSMALHDASCLVNIISYSIAGLKESPEQSCVS